MLDDQINELIEYALEVKETTSRRMAFNRKKQAELLDQFAKPMSVGRKPVAVAEHIAKFGGKQQQIIANDVVSHLESGRSLVNALEGWYDPVVVSALTAAEQAGPETLVEAMEYLARQLTATQKTKAGIVAKWAYPALFVVVSIVIISVLNERIVPLYRSLIDGRADPTLDRFEAVADFYKYWSWAAIACVAAFTLYCRNWLRNTVGSAREQFDRIKMFSSYRLSIGANVVSTFALLKRFGLSGYDILTIMEKQGSAYQRYHLFEMAERLREGGDSEIEALDTGLLDEEYMAMLRLYAESEEEHLVAAMDTAAVDIEERVLKKTEKLGNLIYYALWLWLVANLITVISLMFGFQAR